MAQNWQSAVFSSSTSGSEGTCIQLYEGKQYYTGVFQQDLNIGFNSIAGAGFDDIFIGKSNLDGYTEWLVAICGSQIDRASNIEVVGDEILVSGIFSDSLFVGTDTLFSNYQKSAFIARFDTSGNYIDVFQPEVYNAEYSDFAYNSEGHLIICGEFFQDFIYGSFQMNVISGLSFFVLEYDPFSDEILWAKWGTGSSSLARELCIDSEDNIYITGSYNDGTNFIATLINTGNGNHNLFVAKFCSNGEKQWVNTIEGTNEVHGHGVCCDSLNNVYIIGEFEGLIEIGDTLHSSEGLLDMIVAKLNTNGSYLWSQQLGGFDSDEGYAIELDANMDPIILTTAGINPTFQSTPLNINGWREPLLVKLANSNGDLIWQKSLQAEDISGIVEATSLSIENDKIAITGINRSSFDLNGSTYTAPNSKDFYTALITDSLHYFLSAPTSTATSTFFSYPNPATNYIQIQSKHSIHQIQIINMNGQLIKEKNVFGTSSNIDVSNLNKAPYMLKILIDEQYYVRKIVITN